MKNLKTVLLIFVITVASVSISNAQKLGHIDFEKLISEMPETKALKEDMEKLSKTYKDEISGMEKKLEDTKQKYIAESKSQTDETNDKRAQDLQEKGLKLEQARRFAYQDLQKKQNEELKPIIEKAEKAITEVANAKGITYVLDSSKGKGLLVSKGKDLYKEVKTKLGF